MLSKIGTKKNIAFILSLIISLSLLSCKKFVQVSTAPNLIVSSQVFADSADAEASVVDLYITIMGPFSIPGPSDGAITLYTGLTGDELYPTTGKQNDNSCYQNNILSTSGVVNTLFDKYYTIIYKANACIQGLSSNSNISTGYKNQLLGEAYIVRSLLYFNLINLFGPVPFVSSTNYTENSIIPRNSVDSIYSQLEKDLIMAQTIMPSSYTTSVALRPNQYAATALLAKLYLYENKWHSADSAASSIINSGLYYLEPNLNNVFLTGSNEAIWQLSPVQPGYETAEGVFFVPTDSTVLPPYIITNELLQAFEPNDARDSLWLNYNTVNNARYYYPFKYKLGNDNNSSPLESYMVFRLAEQYLIRAEAEAQLNNLQQSLIDLNTIRNRAGLPSLSSTSEADLLTKIQHERQVELFCEWGNRWFDLKRNNTINSVLGSEKSNWKPTDALYPIPLNDLEANVYLTQNPGY